VLNEVVPRDGQPGSPRRFGELALVSDLDVVNGLRGAGYRVFVITNQPDLSRGLTSPGEMDRIHGAITDRIRVDEVRVCPHDDADGCQCRKPLPGMLMDLASRWNVDLTRSFVIGDTWRDAEAARAAGCASILIARAYNSGVAADHVVSSLTEAVRVAMAEGAKGAPVGHERR
jgi:D-glycero-D-manno-heptose 1,7-bisphosphate phosphatase